MLLKLKGLLDFAGKEKPDQGCEAYAVFDEGFMDGVAVGYGGGRWKKGKDGREELRSDMLDS